MTEVNDNSALSDVRPVYIAVPAPSHGGVDMPDLLRALFERKWLIVAITFLFLIAAVIYSLSATPIYRAEVVLAPAKEGRTGGELSRLSSLAGLAGISIGGGGDSVRSLALLQSKSFIEEFIRDKNLLPALFADEWDAEEGRWRSESPSEQRDWRDGVEYFMEKVRFVSEDPQTGLVTLAIEWTDPEVAAEWATELVDRINEITRRRDIYEVQKKLDYLNDQLAKAQFVELRQAIARVIEEQVNTMMLAQAQSQYAFEVIDPAIVPKQRVRPKRTLIVILGTALGGFIGTFVALLLYAVGRVSKGSGL